MLYEVAIGVADGSGKFDKAMMREFNSIETAVIYGQIVLTFESYGRRGQWVTYEDKKWVPLHSKTIQEETTFGRTVQARTFKALEESGYILRRLGKDSTPYFHVTDKLIQKTAEIVKKGSSAYKKLMERFRAFYLQETGEDLQEVPAKDQEPKIDVAAPAATVENSEPKKPELVALDGGVHAACRGGAHGVQHKGSLNSQTGDGDIYIQARANRILNSSDLEKIHDFLSAELSFGPADIDRTIEFLITHSSWTGTFNHADCEAAAEILNTFSKGGNPPKYFAKSLGTAELQRLASETYADRKQKRREQEEAARSHRKVPFYNWLEDGPEKQNQKRPEEIAR